MLKTFEEKILSSPFCYVHALISVLKLYMHFNARNRQRHENPSCKQELNSHELLV